MVNLLPRAMSVPPVVCIRMDQPVCSIPLGRMDCMKFVPLVSLPYSPTVNKLLLICTPAAFKHVFWNPHAQNYSSWCCYEKRNRAVCDTERIGGLPALFPTVYWLTRSDLQSWRTFTSNSRIHTRVNSTALDQVTCTALADACASDMATLTRNKDDEITRIPWIHNVNLVPNKLFYLFVLHFFSLCFFVKINVLYGNDCYTEYIIYITEKNRFLYSCRKMRTDKHRTKWGQGTNKLSVIVNTHNIAPESTYIWL